MKITKSQLKQIIKEELEEQVGPATDNEQAFSRMSKIGHEMLDLQEEAMNVLRHLDVDENLRNTAMNAMGKLYNPIKVAFNTMIDIRYLDTKRMS
tara:strand:- start:8 stop:292 length:285 start_codon:yes stop_codon:yes gene_type:complete